jgi:alkylhydroperoxidase family enzyme
MNPERLRPAKLAAMARLPYVDPASAPESVAQALDALPPLNVFRMVAHAETAFRPWLRFGGALLGASEVDAVQRELAILRVSKLTPGAEYEWVQHVPILLAAGGTEAQVAALTTGDLTADCFDEAQQLVLRFTTEFVLEAAPEEATWAAASARFSPRQLIELMLVIGQYMMLARIMRTVRLDIDGPIGEEVAEGASHAAARG